MSSQTKTLSSHDSSLFLSRTRAHLRKTTQKLRRTMITTTDWPPPGLIFNSEVNLSNESDKESRSLTSLLSCCLPRCRSNSPEFEDAKKSRLSQMLMGTYQGESGGGGDFGVSPNASGGKELSLRTAADGSLICSNSVDVNMLIEGFREFERRFRYGTLMPFANVLPASMHLSRVELKEDSTIMEEDEGEEEEEDEHEKRRQHERREHTKLVVLVESPEGEITSPLKEEEEESVGEEGKA